MYKITDYSKRQADKLGVYIKPSEKPKYKIDVYDKNQQYITSIGALHYSDYPTYIKTHGNDYATERRRLYKLRHNKDRHKPGSRGFYSDNILW